jgi:hypothetical protein
LYENTQMSSLNYNILFGYGILGNEYGKQVLQSLQNIEESLKEISYCYTFFKESYNVYKHCDRLWVRKERNVEAAIFRNKKGK